MDKFLLILIYGIGFVLDFFSVILMFCVSLVEGIPKRIKRTQYCINSKIGITNKCCIDEMLLGQERHAIAWWQGKYVKTPTGMWSKEDIDFATKMANTLPKNKGGYFDFPENSTSIVWLPGGEKVRATRFWIKNNGQTWYGYPLL